MKYLIAVLSLLSVLATEAQFTRDDQAPKIESSIGVVAGVSSTTLDFGTSSYTYDYLNVMDFESSYSPSFGLNSEFLFPSRNQNWSLYLELNYHEYRMRDQYTDFNQTTHSASISASHLRLLPVVRYHIPFGSFKPFLGIGYGFSHLLKNRTFKTTSYQNSSDPSNPRVESNPIFEDPITMEDGFELSLGLKYKQLGMELRYEGTQGMSNLLAVSSKVRRTYFLLSYQVLSW